MNSMSSEIGRVKRNVGELIFNVEKQIASLPPPYGDFDTKSKAIMVSLLEICREVHLRNEELNERISKVADAARLRTH